jgi:hypothetical protein
MKDSGKDAAIRAHLAACAKCSEKMEVVKGLSGLFILSLEDPPPMRPLRAAQKRPLPAFDRGFKPVFAFTLSIMIVFSGIFLIKHLSLKRDSGSAIPEFVYDTYSTIYDFDYYKTNYIDKTELKLDGGVKK